MNHKEEAKQLVKKFIIYVDDFVINDEGDFKFSKTKELKNAKNCALLCVDEILEEYFNHDHTHITAKRIKHYEKVRQEIENI